MLSFFGILTICVWTCFGSIPPLLNGVFYELYTDVAAWNITQWRQEFESLKAINVTYVAIHTVYDANYPSMF